MFSDLFFRNEANEADNENENDTENENETETETENKNKNKLKKNIKEKNFAWASKQPCCASQKKRAAGLKIFGIHAPMGAKCVV